jgi:hypothetical protein
MTEPKVPSLPDDKNPPVNAEPEVEETIPKERYEGAVKGMNEAQRNAAIAKKESELLRKELELEKQRKSLPVVDPNAEPDENTKKALEAKFGVPYGQINLQNHMTDLKINPLMKQIEELSNALYEEKFENTKGRLKNDDKLFAEYEPEFEAKLNQLPLKERLNKDNILRIKQEVLSDHFEEIVQKARDEERTKLVQSATPSNMPDVNGVSGSPIEPKNTGKSLLSKEQEIVALRMGVDPKSVEQHINQKPGQKKSGWSNYFGK